MSRKTSISGVVLILLAAATFVLAQNWQYPRIKDFGGIVPVPGAATQPDKSLQYKVVFNITRGPEQLGSPNPGLSRVARFLNLLAAANVPADRADVVAVIHGTATTLALKPEIYRRDFGADHPDPRIVHALRRAGVKLYVCGQSLAEHNIQPDMVNPDIEVADSALIVLANCQLRGYALIPD